MAADLDIARIALTTNLAAATGTLGAMAVSWLVIGKPDASMTLNGVLAGLVAIIAPCAVVSPMSAATIGLLGGAGAVLALDRMGIGDPVGAISVHGLSGALGTACVDLFAERRYAPAHTLGDGLFFGGGVGLLVNQVLGVAAVFGWCLACGLLVFGTLKRTIGLRVSAEEEVAGLDLGAHGSQAYPDFQPTARAPVPVGHYPDAAIQATPELRRPPGREPVPITGGAR